MSVPFIDLKRWEPSFIEAWKEKLVKLSEKAHFIGGEENEKLESSLSKDSQNKFAITCANGTDALQIALRTVEIGPRDIVLLPDFTFWASFEAIVNVGAIPITVDINPNDMQMDYELYCEACQKHKPKAAILVHLFGWGSQDIEKFRNFSKKNGIYLIEDGAQSYGSLYKGHSIYKEAQIATLSFYPAKVFGGAGDGGCVLTSDESLGERIRTLANHGRNTHYSYDFVGWNSRLDTLQAAFLNIVYTKLPSRIESRRNLCNTYRKKFLGHKEIQCISPPKDFQENGYLNVLIIPEKRDNFIHRLKGKKIGFATTYPETISEQKGAINFLQESIGGEMAKKTSLSILNLPVFPYMREDEIEASVRPLLP